MELSGPESVSSQYDPIQYRRDHIHETRRTPVTKEEPEAPAISETTPSNERDPFAHLVKAVKNTDLTLDQKKTKLHYAKTALSQMDDKQADTFVRNLQKLMSFNTDKPSRHTGSLGYSNLQNLLNAQQDLTRQLIEQREIKGGQKLTIPTSSNPIDPYADYLNETYKQFNQTPAKENPSLDTLS